MDGLEVKEMALMSRRRPQLRHFFRSLLRRRVSRIGIYGPPNAGKTTLANKLVKDWAGEDDFNKVSGVPHETRRVQVREGLRIRSGSGTLWVDIADTPGISTKVDYHDFLEFGLDVEVAKIRARQATEGVIDAIRFLDRLDGVLVVLDSSKDPYTQVDITLVGNMEARNMPILIVANKIDLPGASPYAIEAAYPQHKVVKLSALKGTNIVELYQHMVRKFG